MGFGGYGGGCCYGGYGYGGGGCGFGSGFALIIVLFVLLIIIGASCFGGFVGGCYSLNLFCLKKGQLDASFFYLPFLYTLSNC